MQTNRSLPQSVLNFYCAHNTQQKRKFKKTPRNCPRASVHYNGSRGRKKARDAACDVARLRTFDNCVWAKLNRPRTPQRNRWTRATRQKHTIWSEDTCMNSSIYFSRTPFLEFRVCSRFPPQRTWLEQWEKYTHRVSTSVIVRPRVRSHNPMEDRS